MIARIFAAQNSNKYNLRTTNSKERILKLEKLKKEIKSQEDSIYKALSKDLRKSYFEAALTEIYFVYGEIDHAIKNLSAWMRPKSAARFLPNILAKNKLYYEPKGSTLIIAPWNYPFQLVMGPLVSAIAAGNTVIVKPSEFSKYTSEVMQRIINSVFNENEVACVLGDVEVSTELLSLPFDHIFFTGSTQVGKIVMEAAAKNLTSCTLELGGKSPVVITETADIETAAHKIAWGKLMNAGQTCIAPDYVLIHESQKDSFIGAYKKFTKEMFFNGENINAAVYGKIINEKNFDRLVDLLNEAVDGGARVDFGGRFQKSDLTFQPTIVTQLNDHHKLSKEEIFGPILPIYTFKTLEEAVTKINNQPKPLAAYFFSQKTKEINYLIKNTSAGGTCVNDVLLHISNPNVPFGGIGPSGMGSSHGVYGFKAFSHERTVMFQSKIHLTKMIYPPYLGKEWLLKLLKKLY